MVMVRDTIAFISAFHLRQQLSYLLFVLICWIGTLLVLPVIGVLLAFGWLYRKYVTYRLSKHPGFMTIMDGMDAYWAQETTTSSANITILLMIESKAEETEGADNLKTFFKAKINSELLTQPKNFKMKCKRMLSEFGYYYWEEHTVDLDEQIRWMDLEEFTEESLKEYLSRIVNRPLPFDNRAVWEILVGRKSLDKDGKKVFPILLRLHHSIGDGMCLMNMFVNSCSDEGSKLSPMQIIEQKMMKAERRRPIVSLSSLLQRISMLIFAPVAIVSWFLSPKDENVLSKDKLSGEKHVLWSTGNDSLSKIRTLKQKFKCTFFDIALLAVSDSLENFFKKSGKPPVDVMLVSPVRLPNGDKHSKDNLSNRFIFFLMKLPISETYKLETIHSRTQRLPLVPEYLGSYWVVNLLWTLFPLGLMQYMRYAEPTLAVSNIPGPVSCAHVDGHSVTNAMFWVPNWETNGVGFSVLSYNGKLTFAAQIDKACIAEKEEVQAILDGIISAIDNMYKRIC